MDAIPLDPLIAKGAGGILGGAVALSLDPPKTRADFFLSYNEGGFYQCALNGAAGFGGGTLSGGLIVMSRTASGEFKVYEEGALNATVANTSAGIADSDNFKIGTGGVTFWTGLIGCAGMATGWDATQVGDFRDRYDTLRTALAALP